MENFEKKSTHQKERHGCVTAWLILMIIVNSIAALFYFLLLYSRNEFQPQLQIPDSILVILGVFSVFNVIFSFLLFNWKKIGFTGFAFTALIVFFINMYMGLAITQSIMGLLGIAILYAILQIKNDDVSTWENLE